MPREGPPRSPRRPGTAGQSRDGRSMKQATPPGQWVPPLPRRVGGKLARVSADEHEELATAPLPVRASIYIAPDGTVHFGALFAELLPVAAALSTSPPTFPSPSPSPSPSTSTS